MTSTQKLPKFDVKQVIVRGNSIARRTTCANDGATKFKLRRRSKTSITIDIFLPHMAHDVEFRFPPSANTTIQGRHLGRVARINLSGALADQTIARLSASSTPQKEWRIEEVLDGLSHVLSGVYFVY